MGEGGFESGEIEALLRLAQSGSFGSRVIGALVRRILEIQDHVEEHELLAMVAQVEALLRSGAAQ